MNAAIGITPPTNFPDQAFGDILGRVQAYCGANGLTAQLATFGEAWNGMAYRYQTACEADDAYSSSIRNHGKMPPPPERYSQERELFAFFTCSLSVLETLGRSLDVLGRLAGAAFTTRARPYPKDVAKAFLVAYPGDALTVELNALVTDGQFVDLNDIRNALSHGGAPPRRAYVGGAPRDPDWGLLTVDENTTQQFLAWLDTRLPRAMQEAGAFAATRI